MDSLEPIWLHNGQFIQYNVLCNGTTNPFNLEMTMIRKGGRWKKADGEWAGEGLDYHFKKLIRLLWPRLVWHKWLHTIIENYLEHRTEIIIGPASTGKAQPLDSVIMTPNGPRLMAQITPGDFVLGADGRPVRVSNTYPQGSRTVWEVSFSDGSTVECSKDHLWEVQSQSGWIKLMDTQSVDHYINSKRMKLCVRRAPASEFSEREQCLDPYLIGALIGDGCMAGTCLGFSSVDKEVLDRVRIALPVGHRLVKRHNDCDYAITVGNEHGGRFPNQVVKCLVRHGLWGKKSPEKFIPPDYLYGSIRQRVALLQGLMDTDGYVSHGRTYGTIAFSTSSRRLARDFKILVESLGGACQISAKIPSFIYKGEMKHGLKSYCCSVMMPDASEVFYLTRKKQKVQKRSRAIRARWITSVRKTSEQKPMQCIQVESPDGLYLTNNFVVTHNTFGAAVCVLADYYCYDSCTTVIICSTTKERLEDRIWGEIKSLHREAKLNYRFVPGNMIEGRQRLVTDPRSEAIDGRDFRNGVVGVPCKRGDNYVGLGDFIGIKNKRVRLLGDELHLLPRPFVDAISNLDKNPDFKCIGLGNPKDTTDALGVLAEPAADLGGWEGGIDQTEKSKTWRTRRPDGVCIQLVGTDSPNLDGKLGIPLISQEAIDRDIAFYGKDSLQYTMMNLGMMPRGQGSRRVITRQMCQKFGALNPPIWKNSNRVKIAFLDAAYRGVGGDRCVFGHLEFGAEATSPEQLGSELVSAILSQKNEPPGTKTILALIEMLIVPIKVVDTIAKKVEEVEDQITLYCMNQCASRGIPPENFFYDSGMRTSLVSSMTRIWSVNTNPIDCGGIPSERKVSEGIDVLCKDYYSKKITEFWYSVRLIIEAGQFRGMLEEVMLEGCSREWKMVGANKIEIESKEEMKSKTGRSPDLFDALAVGVEGARQRGFQIGRLSKPVRMVKGQKDWRDALRDKMKELVKQHSLNYRA